ncbi:MULTISPECIES: Lpg1974 family pore-forming outer membrane protein [Legionella]|uniref:Major outer membrane protein n=1 Tax=Legionella septentrionalis TaxID=2498109 RepID=A0A433JMM9_9GAMM|nr:MULTISPECIES: Lpg1974 family pore-forming outer membrane protein [Legionella]MCP0913047.1 Lpg1974 family pore-forming outer membrane protein [Legionella sp. 27cVA30]RUQ91502.1 hypothetical protein EKM59_00100 [Legionella septentrionalis]RUQ98494.1 hypothetical protein ELY11_05580 [Legionella septentrionalis]RUR10878.1 hypothetical protein ELY14_03480 [Legionella septentrionalis]RUR14588.1 hypothetical protein ELY10_08180 [Legionella septentrionalis]
MNKIKTIVSSLLILGMHQGLAGNMGNSCTPGIASVPCPANQWSFGIQALYLKPTYDNALGWVETSEQPTATGTSEFFVPNNPNWSLSFKLEGAYQFNTGNDLNLNWYHLGHKDTQFAVSSVFTGFIGGNLTENDYYTIEPAWDAVNLELGQTVNFGTATKIRFHGGAQYAAMNIPLTFQAEVLSPTFGLYAVSNAGFNAKYRGFGPRFGAELNYDLGHGIEVYGQGAAALLAGASKMNFANASTFIFSPTNFSSVTSSRTALVPEMEARLGVNYHYLGAYGDLIFNFGYLWFDYLSPFLSNPQASAGESDFGAQGIQAGLKWTGNLA